MELALLKDFNEINISVPLHRIALLYGAPGTGKTTLIKGAAVEVARKYFPDGLIFAEVNTHAIPSEMLGESQRNTSDLLEKAIPELTRRGMPVVVLIDEIDSLATDRNTTSSGRDPIDVSRATEAALRGLDYLMNEVTNVVVIATSNFEHLIDAAFLDRCDMVIELPLPDTDAIYVILKDSLESVTHSISETDLRDVSARLVGKSGRSIRKLMIDALIAREDDFDQPISKEDLLRAL
jgi:SpoVK/Ycf46/Vps4 family AAA+-type ATPase